MYFSGKKIKLKDGRICILKTARPEDAAGLIACLRTAFEETPFLLRDADEFRCTVEEEQEFLRKHLENLRSFLMLAEVEGKVAANCGIMPKGTFRRLRHRCDFAISIRKEFWSLGIGSSMTAYALKLAEQMGYEQVELGVVDGNDRAKALYERFGFAVIGKVFRAMKYGDGSYRDEWMMVKVFGKQNIKEEWNG